MFGYVSASLKELSEPQRQRYQAVYCGLCRGIRRSAGQTARLSLSYDMAFLALLHMSLYEPEETAGNRACGLHPVKPRPWVDCESIRYAADMNVVLAYYKCLDDWNDQRKLPQYAMAKHLQGRLDSIRQRYPRQCQAVADGIRELEQLEQQTPPQPDRLASCFGRLLGELMVYKEDMWASDLRKLGLYLGRFIYLADAVVDLPKDLRAGRFNPLIGEELSRWEECLVLDMARCTQYFEKLPLVQDKDILDNILYSGVWIGYRKHRIKEKKDERESL